MGNVIDITGMVAHPDTLPNRIRYWRLKRGMRLEDLAERVNSKGSTVSRIETGVRALDVDWLRIFARALDVTPGDLLNAQDNPLVALSEEQRFVVDTMIDMGPGATRTLRTVSEGLRDFAAEPPADRDIKRA